MDDIETSYVFMTFYNEYDVFMMNMMCFMAHKMTIKMTPSSFGSKRIPIQIEAINSPIPINVSGIFTRFL